MLEPDGIIDKARDYLGKVLPEFAALKPKVEEMSLSLDRTTWRILFYAHTGDNLSTATLSDVISRRRIEKEVTVQAENGTLVAVKNPAPF